MALRIVAVTPAGRRRYMEVLAPYLFAYRGVVSEWAIWVNTHRPDDVAYCRHLRSLDPGYVRLVEHPRPIARPAPQPPFYRTAVDPDATYVKFDDDICWVGPRAVENLVEFRRANPEYFVVMANTICNGYCAAIHQRNGSMPFRVDGEIVRMDRHFDNKLYRSPRIAEYVHRTFIADVLRDDLAKYHFPEHPLDGHPNFSINCIAWGGSEFARFGGAIEGDDEERWLCTTKPAELGRRNCVCGTSLVSHFGYYTHRRPFCGDQAETDGRILDAYRLLAQRFAGEEACRLVWGRDHLPPATDAAVLAALRARPVL